MKKHNPKQQSTLEEEMLSKHRHASPVIKILFIAFLVVVPLVIICVVYSFSDKIDVEGTSWQSILIVIGIILFVLCMIFWMKSLGSNEPKTYREENNVPAKPKKTIEENASVYLSMGWSRAIAAILGLAVLGFGIWFLWEHYHSSKNESVAVPPAPNKVATVHQFKQNECLNRPLPGKALVTNEVNYFDKGDTLYYIADQSPRNYMPEEEGSEVVITIQDISCESGYYFQFKAKNDHGKPVWIILVDHTDRKPCGATIAVTTDTKNRQSIMVKNTAFNF